VILSLGLIFVFRRTALGTVMRPRESIFATMISPVALLCGIIAIKLAPPNQI